MTETFDCSKDKLPELKNFLLDRNFSSKPINDGTQFKFENNLNLNVFDSGRIVAQNEGNYKQLVADIKEYANNLSA